MIFNELYSAYYNTVAKIIARMIEGGASEKELNKIVCENAFGESVLAILPSLKNEKWQLARGDLSTPIRHKPTMPLTLLQKQWLKAVSLDPRIRLFGAEISGLEDVEPLFTAADCFVYDKYGDGDPYQDEGYIARFRTALSAVRDRQSLTIQMLNRKGRLLTMTVLPVRLEYSEKDDKFRLLSTGCRYGETVNLARIVSCEKGSARGFAPPAVSSPPQRTVVLRICDERNALERCMLHFAHFEKRAERIGEKHYLVHIRYDKDDETEMVIRVLGFGPLIEVIEPNRFRNLIIERLQRQKGCGLF